MATIDSNDQTAEDAVLKAKFARDCATRVGPDGEPDTVHLVGIVPRHELLGGRPRLRLVPNPSHVAREGERGADISSGTLRS